MTNSTLCRLFAPSGSFLIGAIALVFGSFGASAQVYSRTQDFASGIVPNNTPATNSPPTTTSLAFAVVNITNAASYGYYNASFVRASNGGAFGVNDPNNSATPNILILDFAPQIVQANSTKNEVAFQLGSSDFDQFNHVRVAISVDGVETTVLTLTGPQGNGVRFNIGTGATATVNYPVPQSLEVGPSGIGNIVINLPSFPTRTTVGLRITIDSAKGAVDLIDNVKITSDSPLPVELTRFAAITKGQSVNVDWATATEKNSDRFEVQRSATGEAFQTVGTVKGQGNTSSAHNYAFVDSRPLAGRSYYRLRQVDTDGTTAFSPVAAVQLRNELAVYPNPSAGIVTLPATLGDVRYRLLNTIGQTLLSGQATGNDQLDLTKLAKGTFFLEITGEAGRTTQRLVRE